MPMWRGITPVGGSGRSAAPMVNLARTVGALLLAAGVVHAGGDEPTFFLAPGSDPSGDLAYQSELAVTPFEEAVAGGLPSIDGFAAGPVLADVNLLAEDGSLASGVLDTFASTEFVYPGVVFENTVLNRAVGSAQSRIEIVFSQPVTGFGVWIFDDNDACTQSFELLVQDVDGDLFTSMPLDNGLGAGHAVEGFLGAVHWKGISRVEVRQLGSTGCAGTPAYFELDHLQVGPPTPWQDLGQGLAGTHGIPALTGLGQLVPGSPVGLTLKGALEDSVTALVMGLGPLGASFKGGTLVPRPDVIVAGIPIDGIGGVTIGGTWPAGVPSGASFWSQHWISEPLAIAGLAASNGLRGTAP